MRDADAMISRLSRRPRATAFLLDFDGSLATIVDHAADARPLPEALVQLRRLAGSLGRVAIVSGRPVEFLATHVPVEDVMFAGLYGMERLEHGVRSVDARVEPYLPAVAAATRELLDELPPALVESKAGVSVTLHWRPDPERAAQVRAVAEVVARRHGLSQLHTRMAVELRAPVAIDKGDATHALIAGFDVAAFAGDDRGDLPAFAALEAARAAGRLDEIARIGVSSPEAPPELADVVDLLVDGPSGLVAFLTRLADEIV